MGTATVMALGFLAIISLGAILLMLPISSANGEFTSPLTALFTAVSATCVTGLVVVETGLYWSLFGKVVIITLIQIALALPMWRYPFGSGGKRVWIFSSGFSARSASIMS